MKRILLALALLFATTSAFAQCNGVFPNNTVCGNVTGSSNLPRPTNPTAFQGSAGGSNTQVQYNNAGVLAGITGATSNGTTLTLVAPILGTPASATLTNATGLPVSTGISGLAAGIATWLATPSSANLRTAVTDETGTGALAFANGPSLIGPSITNGIGMPDASQGIEMGAKASANTPFIDFNSSGNTNDYDCRLIASAGTTIGTGTLTATCGTLALPTVTSTSISSTGQIKSSSATAGIGYATGAGCAVTQATNKGTNVTCNGGSGQITLNNASMSSNTNVSFQVSNSAVAATDTPVIAISSGASAASYLMTIESVGSSLFRINIRNTNAGSLGEAFVINFAIIKGVAN